MHNHFRDHSAGKQRRRAHAPRLRARGMALLMVMLVVAVAAVLGYAMLASSSLQSQVAGNIQRASSAELLAESGINLAMYYTQNLSKAPNAWVVNNPKPGDPILKASGVSLGTRADGSAVDGTFDFTVIPDPSSTGQYVISATGHARPGTPSQANHTSSAVIIVSTVHLGVGSNAAVTLKNNAYTDSFYINSIQPWDAAFGRANGTIVTNGFISLDNGSKINGDATPGIGKTATGGTVTGSRSPLTTAISYPAPDGSSYALVNDNSQVASYVNVLTGDFSINSGQTATFLGGNYYFQNFTMADNAQLNIKAPVTIYINKTLTIKGGFTLPYNLAAMIKFRVMTNKPVVVDGGAFFYMDLYAPKSDVTIQGKSHVFGSVVGGTLTIDGGAVHWDEGLDTASVAASGPIRIVSYKP